MPFVILKIINFNPFPIPKEISKRGRSQYTTALQFAPSYRAKITDKSLHSSSFVYTRTTSLPTLARIIITHPQSGPALSRTYKRHGVNCSPRKCHATKEQSPADNRREKSAAARVRRASISIIIERQVEPLTAPRHVSRARGSCGADEKWPCFLGFRDKVMSDYFLPLESVGRERKRERAILRLNYRTKVYRVEEKEVR